MLVVTVMYCIHSKNFGAIQWSAAFFGS